MSFRQLYLFIEGSNDRFFVDSILKPKLKNLYDHILPWETAGKRIEQIEKFTRSLDSMGADYFILRDINSSSCVTEKKEEIQKQFSNKQILEKLIIVIKEIESWYLAGLDNTACKILELPSISDTNNITKEDFNRLLPKKFDSRIDFMVEIQKIFSIEIAKSKNNSFRYFMDKLSL